MGTPTATSELESSWRRLQDRVKVDITGLEGQQLNVPEFEKILKAAVESGHVKESVGEKVLHDVKFGVDPTLDEELLKGVVFQRNYKSAYDHREKVTSALAERVKAGKTIKLGNWDGDVKKLHFIGDNARVVPFGSVPKKLERDKVRPFNDHSATGFNRATQGYPRLRLRYGNHHRWARPALCV